MKKRNPFLLRFQKIAHSHCVDFVFISSACLTTKEAPFIWITQDQQYFNVKKKAGDTFWILQAATPIELFLKLLKHSLIELPPMSYRQAKRAQIQIDFENLNLKDYEVIIKKIA